MSYKNLYSQALNNQANFKASYTTGKLKLKSLTVYDALAIGLAFYNSYDGSLPSDNYFSTLIMLSCSDSILSADIKNEAHEDTNGFNKVINDYYLFYALLTTPPVPPLKEGVDDYTEKEKITLIKNNLLAIDAMVRVFVIEANIDIKKEYLAHFNAKIGAMVINGGLLQSDRIANALRIQLEQIAYVNEIANVYASANGAKNPNTVFQSGMARLQRSGYFQPTALHELVRVRDKKQVELIRYVTQQVDRLHSLKKKDLAAYNEVLRTRNMKIFQNQALILEGRKEAEFAQMFVIDKGKLDAV